MKAKITFKAPTIGPSPQRTPVLGLECRYIFETEDGIRAYVPTGEEYVFKLGGMRSPSHRGFSDVARVGVAFDIEYENIKGENIVTLIGGMPVS